MHDAAMERLSKVITDTPRNSDEKKSFREGKPNIDIHIGLAEGWLSLFLLAAVVYSTIWSVQVAGWVDNLNILSLTTAIGLLLGVFATKQQRFPRPLVYCVIFLFGLLLAFWQTARASNGGDIGAFIQGIRIWFSTITAGGTTSNNTIFLFLITALSFALASMSAWLLYSMRSPWLMVIANAVVLLINLNNMTDGIGIFFLVLFLIAALMLLLRFNLYESMVRWRRQGLRYPDDLGWDIMQAGAFISIGILVCSWILPGGYSDPLLSQIWSTDANPLVRIQDTWDRIISVNPGSNPVNHGNFRDTLVLGGNPNLDNTVVLRVNTDDSSTVSPYLQYVAYQTYSNGGWSLVQTDSLSVRANLVLSPSATSTHNVKQTITIVNAPGEQNPYILGQADMTSLSLPANLISGTGGAIAWIGKNGKIPSGTTYTVTSAVSSADAKTLGSVPMPADAPKYTPNPTNVDAPIPVDAFDAKLVNNFTQWPRGIDKNRLSALAQKIIDDAGAKTMYDKVSALETYLRSHYSYNVDIHPQAGEDPVTWFLFDNNHNDGFCNYFASAMTLLARSQGIPARVVAGYAPGTYDVKTHQSIVHGKDAHTWTQVYFAGYGWINFEPSTSFSQFIRPLPNQFSAGGSTSSTDNLPPGVIPPGLHGKNIDPNESASTTADSQLSNEQAQARLRQNFGIAFGGLILLILFGCIAFGIWWRGLFRRYSLAAQLYGRICVLALWAGIRLQPSQTPYEYLQSLSFASDTADLERLGDIYVRERWADPTSREHPRLSGEIDELPGIWTRLQPRLFFYVLRHPHFLRWLPERFGGRVMRMWRKRRLRRIAAKEF